MIEPKKGLQKKRKNRTVPFNSHIADNGADGTDQLFIVKKAGTAWTYDQNTSTLTQTDTKTNEILSTIDISGIEHVGYWNGKTAKVPAKTSGLLFSPPSSGSTSAAVAGSSPFLPKHISIKA